MSNRPSPTSASPSKAPQASQNDTRTALVATVVVVVGLFAIGLAIYLFLRWRTRRIGYDPEQRLGASTAVDQDHVAAQITPYGSTSNLMPRFRTFLVSRSRAAEFYQSPTQIIRQDVICG